MGPTYPAGSGSVAAIRRHPLHPMLVPLPIGFLVGAFAADVVFVLTADTFWARGAFWLLVGGIVTGLAAGLAGAIDMVGVARARRLAIAWLHGVGNVAALLLAVFNVFLRWEDHSSAVGSGGLLLSLVVVVILLVTGWLGGELSYRHGVGVAESVGQAPLDPRRE